MKKLFLSCVLLISYNVLADKQTEKITAQDKDMELLEDALKIVASMSDNIANLVIQHKTKTGSPEMTKQEAVALVEKITDLAIVVIKKAKYKTRSIENFPLYTQEEINAIINKIANKLANDLLEKIE